MVDDFSLKEITLCALWVSIGRDKEGENINPLMLYVMDLPLRNCGGRDRRSN